MIGTGLSLFEVATRVVLPSAASGATVFTATPLATNKLYQRSTFSGGSDGAGAGTISVPINVSVVGSGAIHARIRDKDTGLVIQGPWQVATISATGAATVNVAGVYARKPQFYVDLSGNAGATWINGANPVSMGDNILTGGQSLGVRRFARIAVEDDTSLPTLGITGPAPYGYVYATYTETTRSVTTPQWLVPGEGTMFDSAYLFDALTLEVNRRGCAVAIVGHARGAQTIQTFLSDGGTPGGAAGSEYAKWQAIMAECGGFAEFRWLQGHQNFNNSVAANKQYLDQLRAEAAAANPLGDAFKMLVSGIPNIGNTSFYFPFLKVRNLRQAQMEWCDTNGAYFVDYRDIPLAAAPDLTHQTVAGGRRMAHHDYRATRPAFGQGRGDTGPTMRPVVERSNADLAITVDLETGLALVATGNPGTRFQAYVSPDTATPLAFDGSTPYSMTNNGDDTATINLKLAATPPVTDLIDVYFSGWPDPVADGSADMLYDNSDDGDGIPLGRALQPNVLPLMAFAPGVAAPANTAAPVASGFGRFDQILYCTTGTWSNTPAATSYPAYRYQWYWADNDARLPGAVNATYRVTLADIARGGVYPVVTATNAGGMASERGNTIAMDSKRGPDLTGIGSPSWVTGKFGQALQGANGVYARDPAPTFDSVIPPERDWAMEGWIWLAANPAAVVVPFGQANKAYFAVNTSGQITAYVRGQTTTANHVGPLVADGAWHHLAMQCSAATALAGSSVIYVDGVAVSTIANLPYLGAGSSFFAIGSLGTSNYFVNGLIDGVAVHKGIRFTGNFTPPVAPLVGNEAGVRALYNLNSNFTPGG